MVRTVNSALGFLDFHQDFLTIELQMDGSGSVFKETVGTPRVVETIFVWHTLEELEAWLEDISEM